MLVAIHQPNFLPRPKVLDKILAVDLTIWLDDVQYVRREWQNRALVRDQSGQSHWLSVPVFNKGRWAQSTIAECEVEASEGWRRRHMRTIRHFYAKSLWIEEIEQCTADLWETQPQLLAPFAIESAVRLAALLGRQVPSVLASSIAAEGTRTHHLVALCQAVGASAYLTGTGGLSYLEFDVFKEAGIKVVIQTDVERSGPLDAAWRRLSSLDGILTLGPGTFAESFLKGQSVEA